MIRFASNLSSAAILILLLHICPFPAGAQELEFKLWPESPPGIITAEGEERDMTKQGKGLVAGKTVIRLGHVSEPMLTVYSAPKDKNTGAAVVVCPGGGYSILAYDLEGTEVCEWLNSIGVTGVLLKYRVPRPKTPKPAGGGRPKPPIGPLMDAQRALSMVRSNAEDWNIDPGRIGVLGFSAGGHLAASLSTNYAKRAYDAIDAVDEVSCRPSFSVLIYPAYFYGPGDELISEALPVDQNTPPAFLTMTWDDGVGAENILRMGIALKRNNVEAEVHLYPRGGHGYGLRRNANDVTTWPARCEEWMRGNGWLQKEDK
ncbi:MAG: alpha/beta hydrolase [Planctomycetota bacterium]